MSTVVRTNSMALNASRQLSINSSNVSKSLQKLSSGFKINSAADDAAGLAISEHMKAQIKDLDAASSNSQDGISMVQTAEGAMNEVHSMLNRMSELATKAANGTYTDAQRGNYQDEVTSLSTEIDRIGKSTNYNSLSLLNGSGAGTGAATITLQIGDTATDFNQLAVTISAVNVDALGISGINLGTVASAGAALTSINAAIDTVSKQRSLLGATQNRLEHTINNLNTESENLTTANSRIRDADMAKEMMSYTQNNVLSQAAQAMLAQANQQPQQVLQLLQ